jgi:hypothetical protein
MQRVPMMPCADGQSRARQDVAFGMNPVSNSAVTAKTAAYTITAQEYGCAFSNAGASGSVTFTLPTCFAGAVVGPIFKIENQTVVLDGAGSDTIDGGATLQDTASADANRGAVILYGISATAWMSMRTGTWNVV